MIIWSGWGFLTAAVPIALCALGSLAGRALGAAPEGANPGTALGALVAAVVIWYLGRWLNRGASSEQIRAGHPGPLANRHTMFWVPMQYWAPFQLVGGVVAAVITIA